MSRTAGAVVLAALTIIGLAGPSAQQQPQFRAGIDVVQFDVTVLDRNRMPVRGLTAADFTVLEDGRPTQIVGFSAVDLPDRDRLAAAWTAEVGPDVATNRLDANRIMLVFLNDFHTGSEDIPFAKKIANAVVDNLGPSDLGTVVYAMTRRKGQEFTTDHRLLRAAIGRLTSSRPGMGPGGGGGCMRNECLTMALRNAAEVLKAWPGSRKTFVYIGSNPAYGFAEAQLATSDTFRQMTDLQETFAALQQANINIYAFDPVGLTPGGRNEGLRMFAENTGGRAIVNTNTPWEGVAQMFRENGSYYILGFQSDGTKTGRRFRRIEVRVNRPDVDVRTRSGYFPPAPPKPPKKQPPTALARAVSGGLPAVDVPMAIHVTAFARPGKKTAVIAIVAGLTHRGSGTSSVSRETIQMAATAFRDDWKERGHTTQRADLAVTAEDGRAIHHDIAAKLELEPGRYEIRVAIERQSDGKTGSAYASVEVPDFMKEPLSLSGVSLDFHPPSVGKAVDAIGDVIPASPTTLREFVPSDRVAAFFRVYQGGKKPSVAVQLTSRVLDTADRSVFEQTATVDAADFGADRSRDHRVELPLARLVPGAYLLSIEAAAGSSRVDRRIRFRVR